MQHFLCVFVYLCARVLPPPHVSTWWYLKAVCAQDVTVTKSVTLCVNIGSGSHTDAPGAAVQHHRRQSCAPLSEVVPVCVAVGSTAAQAIPAAARTLMHLDAAAQQHRLPPSAPLACPALQQAGR
eukprot:scaffold78563_cov21-Tisochrysis_lutea.AAC.1